MITKAEAQQRTKVYDDEEIQALHLLHLRYLSVTLIKVYSADMSVWHSTCCSLHAASDKCLALQS